MLSYPQCGPVERFEPVIEELLASKPLQRLKRVHQLGVFHFFIPSGNSSRYEHSLGVLMLLRKHGASLEQQIAGLLHDVSHMAFSHVADYLFERWDEELGEDFAHDIIHSTEIADILERHRIDSERVSDPRNFGLLERTKPDLCADRIDYSLRDGVCLGLHGIKQAKEIADDLTVVDGQFVFQTPEIAATHARLFIALDRDFYSSAKGIASFFLMVDAIKAGFETGELTLDDLLKNDDQVLRILIDSEYDTVAKPLHDLMHGFDVDELSLQPTHSLKKKTRYIDPLVIQGNELVRISHIDASVEREIALYLQQRDQPISFSIVSRDNCIDEYAI